MDTSTTINIDDRELLHRLRRCVADDRRTTARLLVHMGEVDARGLYRDEGFSSMFDYCVRALHMSESETALRIRVARFGRAFPAAIQMLVRGELHLSAIGLLAPVVTPDRIALLQEAAFKSKREVEAILAKHFPQPDVPSMIRKLPGTKMAAPELQPSLPATDSIRTPADVRAAPAAHSTGGSDPTFQVADLIATNVIRSAADVQRCAGGIATSENDVRERDSKLKGTLALLCTGDPGQRNKGTLDSADGAGPVPLAGADTRAPLGAGSSGGEQARLDAASAERLSTQAPTDSARRADCAMGGVRPQSEISGSAATGTLVPAYAKQQPAPVPLPLSEGRYKVQFTADQRLRDKLAQAQHLLRHQVADGDVARIVERALDLLIADRRKKLFAHVARPRERRLAARDRTAHSTRPASGADSKPADQAERATATPAPSRAITILAGAEAEPTQRATPAQSAAAVSSSTTGASKRVASAEEPKPGGAPRSVAGKSVVAESLRSRSRHIPSSVKRRVVARDGERCSFIAPDGRRCQERGRLEFHHDQPYALGGPATIENIRLLCRSHNVLLAERDFGRVMVKAATTQQRPDATRRSGRSPELPREPVRSEIPVAREHR